jgi:hypothetical protein
MNNVNQTPLLNANFAMGFGSGERAANCSRNPIDTQTHWNWHNPLNVLPLGVAILVVVSIVLWLAQ